MAQRSLNKVQLIGNLTRDPELRYTPQGVAVCTLGLATNRSWTTDTGEKREEVEFHRLVAWNKLAELCSQLLFKGRKLFVEGRLQTRAWTGQDGAQRQTTEIVLSDMIILDSKRAPGESVGEAAEPTELTKSTESETAKSDEPTELTKATKPEESTKPVEEETTDVKAEDIPF